jgi:hypothetical protein
MRRIKEMIDDLRMRIKMETFMRRFRKANNRLIMSSAIHMMTEEQLAAYQSWANHNRRRRF